MFYPKADPLAFAFTLSLFYLGASVFYVFVIIDFISDNNNCYDISSKLWNTMLVLTINAFSGLWVTGLELVNLAFLMISHCGEYLK